MNKCGACGQDAIFECRKCGGFVCGDHFDFGNGRCAACNNVTNGPAAHVDIPGGAGKPERAAPAPASPVAKRRRKYGGR